MPTYFFESENNNPFKKKKIDHFIYVLTYMWSVAMDMSSYLLYYINWVTVIYI